MRTRHAAHPGVGAGNFLNFGSTGLAVRLEAPEGRLDPIGRHTLQAARQHSGVFDRGGRTLRHVGRHRVAIQGFRHRQFALDFARIANPIQVRIGREGPLAQHGLDADAAQDLHRVRQHLDACADSTELLRLLINLHVEASQPQRCGRSHAAHAGADDRNCGCRHSPAAGAAPLISLPEQSESGFLIEAKRESIPA
jgi:hypothetical protein